MTEYYTFRKKPNFWAFFYFIFVFQKKRTIFAMENKFIILNIWIKQIM